MKFMGTATQIKSTTVYRLAMLCLVVSALAVIVPRFVPHDEGFASAATATLIFLGMLGVAALVAIFLAILTVRHYAALPSTARIAGLSPAVVISAALAMLMLWVSD